MKEQANLKYLQEISGGDKDFENELMSIVIKELPDEIEEYKNNLEQENYLKTAECVHKLKHKISILGLEKGYQVAIDYEEELKKNDSGLQHQFDEILATMVNFISEH